MTGQAEHMSVQLLQELSAAYKPESVTALGTDCIAVVYQVGVQEGATGGPASVWDKRVIRGHRVWKDVRNGRRRRPLQLGLMPNVYRGREETGSVGEHDGVIHCGLLPPGGMDVKSK